MGPVMLPVSTAITENLLKLWILFLEQGGYMWQCQLQVVEDGLLTLTMLCNQPRQDYVMDKSHPIQMKASAETGSPAREYCPKIRYTVHTTSGWKKNNTCLHYWVRLWVKKKQIESMALIFPLAFMCRLSVTWGLFTSNRTMLRWLRKRETGDWIIGKRIENRSQAWTLIRFYVPGTLLLMITIVKHQ